MSSQNYDSLNDTTKKQLILDTYLNKKMSFGDIAEQYNTYANKIRRDAKKFKVPIRDKSLAQKNALSTGKHKHPTKGMSRSEDTKNKIGNGVMQSWESLSAKELKQRKQKSKTNWEKLSIEDKENIVKAANDAARLSSKVGSKLEKFLLNKLLVDGWHVDFHKEQILSNTKLQIDLFLPTINLAIEVDGPSHFLPIWGEDALKKNQKYDEKKNGLIIGKGLKLIRIKQTHDFSQARSNILYKKLLEVLNNKLYQTNSLIEIED
jgi:very-short-patch-repair endonuclease